MINWIKPDLASEVNEYFDNPFTQGYFFANDVEFDTPEALVATMERGRLISPETPEYVLTLINLGAVEDLAEMRAENPARVSSIEGAMRSGMPLPAPIVFVLPNGRRYLFAGNTRCLLAPAEEKKFWEIRV